MRSTRKDGSILTPPLSLARLLVLVALAPTAGCSWIFTQPLRDDRLPDDYPVCSINPAPPLIDTALFALNAGTTIYTAAKDNVSQKALRVSLGATAATLWLLSAVYGYSNTSACRTAMGSHATGPQRPAFGTGGEVFLPEPPPSPPRSRQPQQPQPPSDDGQALPQSKPSPPPTPIEKLDPPRFRG